MTIAEVELLNRSMEGLGNTFQRNRELDIQRELANKRLDIDAQREATATSRYDAQQKHYEKMEQSQADAEAKRQDAYERQLKAMDNATAVKKAAEDAKSIAEKFKEYHTTQSEYVKFLGAQVAANRKDPKMGFDNEAAHEMFTQHLTDLAKSIPVPAGKEQPDLFEKMTQDPNVQMMLSPRFDFGSLPGAGVGEVKPFEFKDSSGNTMSGVVSGKGSMHVTPKAPPAGFTTTQVKQVPSPTGGAPLSLTNTTTRLPSMPLPAPTSAPTVPDPAAILRGAPAAGNTPQSPTAATPGQQHIDYLQAHPEMAPWFDAKFGQGASARYLQATEATQQ